MKNMPQSNQPVRNIGPLYRHGYEVITGAVAGVPPTADIPSSAISGELWRPDLRTDAAAWMLLASLAEALARAGEAGKCPQAPGRHMMRVVPGNALYLLVPRRPLTADELVQDRWFMRISPPEQREHPNALVRPEQTCYAFAALLVSFLLDWPAAKPNGFLHEDLTENPFTGAIHALTLLPEGLPMAQALQGMLHQSLSTKPQERPGMREWHALLLRCAKAIRFRQAMVLPTLPPEATLVTEGGLYCTMLAGDAPSFVCRYQTVQLADGAMARWDTRFDALSPQVRRSFRRLRFPVDMVRRYGSVYLLYEQRCPGPVTPKDEYAQPRTGLVGETLDLLEDILLARAHGLYITHLAPGGEWAVGPGDLADRDDGCAAVITQLTQSFAADGTLPPALRAMALRHALRPLPAEAWINALKHAQ